MTARSGEDIKADENNLNSVRTGNSNFSHNRSVRPQPNGLEVTKIPEKQEVDESVLVIAFDGLDYELIKEFDLENIPQKEFGKIDNTTGMSKRMTSELFASFITGRTNKEHGVRGLKKKDNSIEGKIKHKLIPDYLVENVRGFNFIQKSLERFLEVEDNKYRKEDLNCNTIFEVIENSRAMFIPSYNPSLLWYSLGFGKPLENGYTQSDVLEMWDEREHNFRKGKLFSELENDIIPARDFLMCHFHRVDTHQHFYLGDHRNSSIKKQSYDRGRLKKLYYEIDQLAGKIKDKALDKGYSHVVFMSDHGLPEQRQHNKNAFYSCNKDLFWDYEPKITDFYLKILQLTGNTDQELNQRQIQEVENKLEIIEGKVVSRKNNYSNDLNSEVARKLDRVH